MREIKFRAWDKDEKRMWWNVQSAYDMMGCHVMPECDDSNHEHIFNPCSFESVLSDENFMVMQYTGLKDKRGKEIFDGDILGLNLNTKNPIYGAMCWREDESGWETFWPIGNFEIVGNIYENPELLGTLKSQGRA